MNSVYKVICYGISFDYCFNINGILLLYRKYVTGRFKLFFESENYGELLYLKITRNNYMHKGALYKLFEPNIHNDLNLNF